ncbi:hypothetical protein [Natroniella sp. ANB-PHB2]|uniref:hypothetical protein n=1 Tax=Natroniella sp. ANB-PHB2 TaxID=3384444 RepID=UPI0038D363D1
MKKIILLLIMLSVVLIFTGCQEEEYHLSGTITDSNGNGIEAVTLKFEQFGIATTDEEGRWSKHQLVGPVTVTPVKEGWEFTPGSIEVEETKVILTMVMPVFLLVRLLLLL